MKTSISIQRRAGRTCTIVPGGTRSGVQPGHDGTAMGARVDTLMGTVGARGGVELGGPRPARGWGHGGFMRKGMWQAGQARLAARGDGEVRVGTQTEQRAEVGGSGWARAARREKGGRAEDTGGAAPGWGRTVPRSTFKWNREGREGREDNAEELRSHPSAAGDRKEDTRRKERTSCESCISSEQTASDRMKLRTSSQACSSVSLLLRSTHARRQPSPSAAFRNPLFASIEEAFCMLQAKAWLSPLVHCLRVLRVLRGF